MKKINSTEIARLAGVSRSTVSRVINGYSNVPPETYDRVMKVINENGYYPLLSGQLLVGKGTGTLGFIWVAQGTIANDIQCSAFFVHVTEIAAQLGYLVTTCIVKNLSDEENANWVRRIFMQERVDAGIFIGVDNDEPLIEELIARGKVVGIFDHYHADRAEPNRLSVNFERNTGEKAIDYVCAIGHSEIAVIDGNLARFSSRDRHDGFLAGMRAHGIEPRPWWMICGDVTEEGGYAAALRLLAEPRLPTVICANNDSAAFGVYRALEEAGISVPGQVSLIGIDGHAGGAQLQPPLTTFAFDFEKIFRSLVTRTIAAVEKQPGVAQTEFFPSRLIERESCCRLG